MSNQKISALPRKTVPANNDLIPIVDLQFGSANYVNKKTTVGDLLALVQNYVNFKISELALVTSVNGQSNNVLLNLTQLDDVYAPVSANNDVLAYDAAQSRWVSRVASAVAPVIDCGEF